MNEKRQLKAYIYCTPSELKAWRKKYGRKAVEVARSALLTLCIGREELPEARFKLPPGPLKAVLTIRMTEAELWMLNVTFPPQSRGEPRGYVRYGLYIRRYMNRKSDFSEHEASI